MEDISNKVVVITGATSGIGYEAALLFAEHKIKVVAAGRNQIAGLALIDEITQKGGEAIFIETDITSAKSVEVLMESAITRFGGIDYAFNNAGIEGDAQTIAEMDEMNWDQVIDTNLKGLWLCLKYEFPAIRLRQGAIVNTSTSLTRSGLINTGAYTASKAGVDALTQVAAIEYGKCGVRVNAINPGAVDTPMLRRIYSSDEITGIRKSNPLNDIADSKEVAEVVLWLCSSKASHVNGTCIFVDGGASLLC